MARKCSHCGNCGHNSRTCGGHRDAMLCEGLALRLYGVQRLQIPHAASSASPFKKSYSMPFPPPPPPPFSSLFLPVDEGSERASNGYRAALQERKKGVPWSEEEHRLFLAGLENLGKGDWRGISRSYVTTRTPTQVASHAQKFFLRHNGVAKKKRRRSSLFDMFLVCENGMRVPEPLANGDEARTCLSLNVQCHEFSEKTANDLINHLPGAVLPMEQAHGHGHHCSPLDLELGMCLPRPPEHAVPSSLSTSCSSFIGAVRVN